MLATIRAWAARNRPVVAAIAAAFTPILVALLTGDLQTIVEAWPALANVLGGAAVAIIVGYLTGHVAQQGTTPLADPRTDEGIPLRPDPDLIGADEMLQAQLLGEARRGQLGGTR